MLAGVLIAPCGFYTMPSTQGTPLNLEATGDQTNLNMHGSGLTIVRSSQFVVLIGSVLQPIRVDPDRVGVQVFVERHGDLVTQVPV